MSKKKKKSYLTQAQKYDLLSTAKDALFEVITIKKYSWGYENWCTLMELMNACEYSKMQNIVSNFRNSKNKRYALELINDIIKLSCELHIAC